jgi:hypothetical protein
MQTGVANMSRQIAKHESTTEVAGIHWSHKPRVTFDKLTTMLVDRDHSEALGRFREGGREYYTYLWYGGPKTFLRRLDVKLSEASIEEWSGIFDSLLNAAKQLNCRA